MQSNMANLELSRPMRIDMAVKNITIFCNIQGVSVYTNVSANYMFRPHLVRPSSGWIQWSEEIYNNAIYDIMIILHYCIVPLTLYPT